MNGYLPRKPIVFFNPGRPGIVATRAAHTIITARALVEAQEELVQMTGHPIVYIEDRRLKKR